MELDEIYRQAILEHARHPHNCDAIPHADVQVEMVNKLCGDELELTMKLEEDQIIEAAVRARGCAIVIASSSLMTDYIRGKSPDKARWAGTRFMALLDGEKQPKDVDLEPLFPLLNLKDHRSRHRCATLPWEALEEACRRLAEKS